jgi:hypothetical protein
MRVKVRMILRLRERETSGLDDDWRSLEVIVSIRTGSGYPSCALVEFVL